MDARRRVLVVEDDADVRETLALALREAGFEATVAIDGVDGLERLRAGFVPDVLLIDLRMPRLDGESLVTAVRSDVRFADLPVITMTGDPAEPTARGEVVAHLRKPFDLDDLLAIIASVCEAKVA